MGKTLSPLSIPRFPPTFGWRPTRKAPALELLCFVALHEAVGRSPQLKVDDGTGEECLGQKEEEQSWEVNQLPSLRLSVPQDVPQRTIDGLDSQSIYRSVRKKTASARGGGK
jgi:hypothetical protein